MSPKTQEACHVSENPRGMPCLRKSKRHAMSPKTQEACHVSKITEACQLSSAEKENKENIIEAMPKKQRSPRLRDYHQQQANIDL